MTLTDNYVFYHFIHNHFLVNQFDGTSPLKISAIAASTLVVNVYKVIKQMKPAFATLKAYPHVFTYRPYLVNDR